VAQFRDDALAQLDGLSAPAAAGLGASLFVVLEATLGSAEVLAGSGPAGAIRVAVTAALADAQHGLLGTPVDSAAGQLRHALEQLDSTVQHGATAGWHTGTAQLPGALHSALAAGAGQGARTPAALCDLAGVPDPAVLDPSYAVVDALWSALHAELQAVAPAS
jgi:hypothetical protein